MEVMDRTDASALVADRSTEQTAYGDVTPDGVYQREVKYRDILLDMFGAQRDKWSNFLTYNFLVLGAHGTVLDTNIQSNGRLNILERRIMITDIDVTMEIYYNLKWDLGSFRKRDKEVNKIYCKRMSMLLQDIRSIQNTSYVWTAYEPEEHNYTYDPSEHYNDVAHKFIDSDYDQ